MCDAHVEDGRRCNTQYQQRAVPFQPLCLCCVCVFRVERNQNRQQICFGYVSIRIRCWSFFFCCCVLLPFTACFPIHAITFSLGMMQYTEKKVKWNCLTAIVEPSRSTRSMYHFDRFLDSIGRYRRRRSCDP